MNEPSTESAVDLATPRFDLRFQAGEGRLVLRRPVQAFPARVEALTLAVPLPRRFDLAKGTGRLRQMRSTLEEAQVEVRWRALTRAAEAAGASLALRGLRGGRLALAIREATGVLAAELDVLADGVDLVFGLRRLDWVRQAPRPALQRLIDQLAALGLHWSAADGVFRLRRPLRSLLAETLLPAGYRLPEERALGIRLEVRRRGVVIQTEGTPTAADLDRYRRMVQDPPDWLNAAIHGEESPVARAPLEELPSPWLRGDAIRARLERALSSSREPLAEPQVTALLDALSIHRRDVALWREWIVRLGERRDPGVVRLVGALLELPIAERQPLVVEAITQAAKAGASAESLEPMLERAERAAPGSPHLWALRAALTDDDSQAAELWTRAADAVSDDALAGRWLCSAAERLRSLRGPEAALPLARRACDASPSDVHARVLHAELLEALGRDEALAEAFAVLLDLEPEDDASEELWERGLARAATFHVQRGEHDRARPYLAAMEDRVPFPTDPGILEAPFDLGVDGSAIFEDPPSGEIELDRVPGEEDSGDFDRGDAEDDSDWPKSEIWEAPPKDLVEEDAASFDDDWSPSEVWDAEPRIADQGEPGESEGPESGTHEAPPRPSEEPRSERTSEVAPASESRSEPPMVTQIGVTDDEMRALLEDVSASDDPVALLEGAIEGAFDDEDVEAVERVLTVLDRVTTLPDGDSIATLRRRALAWLAKH